MNHAAPYPLSESRLTLNERHVVHGRTGKSTDVYHISGDVHFTSIGSRFVDGALKVIRVSPTDRNQIQQVENFLNFLSQHLSASNAAYTHPNIAPMNVVNVTRTTECQPINFKAILSPWYSRGNVLEHVNAHPGADRFTLIIELARAIKHLHSHGVVHGAIHLSNILTDNNNHIIVTDAGVRTLISQHIFTPHFPTPPSAVYQPSEQLRPMTNATVLPTTSTDVYSFATTTWTIFAGKKPFSNFTPAQIVVEIGTRGHQRLVKPSNMSAGLWVILRKCLAVNPALRPTMIEVVAELESLSL